MIFKNFLLSLSVLFLSSLGLYASEVPKEVEREKSSDSVAQTTSSKSVEVKGYNGLYMGHSFFKPAAEVLKTIIPDTSIMGHTGYIVMSGGPKGSPKMLWDNEGKRKAGLTMLDTGKVEFFAMTYFDGSNSSIKDYSQWFDHAILKNPSITFMVALPWGPFLFATPKSELDKAEKIYEGIYNDLIVPLRKKYPQNKIIYCPYGLGVYELVRRLDQGKLPGVKFILSPDKSKTRTDQILRDPLGHGTDLVTLLNSLVWLQTIYNYDLSSIDKKYRAKGLPDIDLNEIALKIHEKIKPYNELYK